MATRYAILGLSGSGKSSSIHRNDELEIMGLDPKETVIINIMGKDLPFKGWKTFYKEAKLEIQDKQWVITQKGNYLNSRDKNKIIAYLKWINTVPACKNVVIDDLQYIMGDQFMDKALEKGWDKYNIMAKDTYDIISMAAQMRDDMTFGILTHAEAEKSGDSVVGYKWKTIGKLLDEKISLEGLFTVLLFTDQEATWEDGKPIIKKYFVTNYDGKFDKAKSPPGMFPSNRIPNDLGLVVKSIKEYEGI
jgi:hypothetical protein